MTIDQLVSMVGEATHRGSDAGIHRATAHGTALEIEFADGSLLTLRVTDIRPSGVCRSASCGALLDKEEGPWCRRCEQRLEG